MRRWPPVLICGLAAGGALWIAFTLPPGGDPNEGLRQSLDRTGEVTANAAAVAEMTGSLLTPPSSIQPAGPQTTPQAALRTASQPSTTTTPPRPTTTDPTAPLVYQPALIETVAPNGAAVYEFDPLPAGRSGGLTIVTALVKFACTTEDGRQAAAAGDADAHFAQVGIQVRNEGLTPIEWRPQDQRWRGPSGLRFTPNPDLTDAGQIIEPGAHINTFVVWELVTPPPGETVVEWQGPDGRPLWVVWHANPVNTCRQARLIEALPAEYQTLPQTVCDQAASSPLQAALALTVVLDEADREHLLDDILEAAQPVCPQQAAAVLDELLTAAGR